MLCRVLFGLIECLFETLKEKERENKNWDLMCIFDWRRLIGRVERDGRLFQPGLLRVRMLVGQM